MPILSQQSEQEIVNKTVEAVFNALENYKPQEIRYLQTNQAAEYVGVSKVTLNRWVSELGLKNSKIGGVVLFDVEDLNEFVAKHKI